MESAKAKNDINNQSKKPNSNSYKKSNKLKYNKRTQNKNNKIKFKLSFPFEKFLSFKND